MDERQIENARILAGLVAAGIAAAFTAGALNSSIGWRGIGKKVLTILIVVMAKVAEPLVNNIPLANAVAGFYAAIEALSIMENALQAGVPAPAFLREALVKVRDTTGGNAPAPKTANRED
jgi:toxin secretion/phage lysis holin